MTLDSANILQVLLFVFQIIPALVYSLLKEKRFVKRNSLFMCGLLTISFGVIVHFNPLADLNVLSTLPLFFIAGFVLVIVAYYTKRSRTFLLGYKSVAAFEIPIVLYIYGVIITRWDWVMWSGIALCVAFNLYSYMIRRESDAESKPW